MLVASRSADRAVDLATGEGLGAAIGEADTVIHLASDPRLFKRVDIGGTERVLEAIEQDQRLIYVSIVGVDRHPRPYYRAKHEVEQMIAATHERHVILRATQFHDYVAYFLGAELRPMIALIPKKFVFQPIDTGEVASQVAGLVHSTRAGLLPDVGGPEVLTAEHLARTLMAARGLKKPMLNRPVPGRSAAAYRAGLHTNPDAAVGVRTWAEYLGGFAGGGR